MRCLAKMGVQLSVFYERSELKLHLAPLFRNSLDGSNILISRNSYRDVTSNEGKESTRMELQKWASSYIISPRLAQSNFAIVITRE